jgi:enolase
MSSVTIDGVLAREVLDSRGKPTVEAEVICSDGSRGLAIVPSGASTGKAEAVELRDGDPDRYDGQGVQRAVAHVVEILGPAVLDVDVADQAALDARMIELDGTPQKSWLGANAMLGISLAAAHAAAAALRIPLYEHVNHLWRELPGPPLPAEQAAPRLPLPMTNMISGGLHAGGNLDFQDFLISPVGAPDYATGLEWIVRVYRRLGGLLHEAGYEGRLVGDEGGYGPRLPSNRAAAEFVVRAIEAAGLRPGRDVMLNLDVASTHFWDGVHYRLATDCHSERSEESRPRAQETLRSVQGDERGVQGDHPPVRLSTDQMIDQLAALVDEFPIISIEDGLAEEDWPGWERLTARLGERVILIGDDLFATSIDRLRRGIDVGAANGVLVKVNQIGTLTETLQTMRLAAAAGYVRVVSARSGETEDTTIADLAVGTAAQQIKIGSIVRSERLAKYNRLLRIAEELP